MQEQKFRELLKKGQLNQLEAEELKRFEILFEKRAEFTISEEDVDAAQNRVFNKINRKLFSRRRKLVFRYAASIAIILGVSLGLYFYESTRDAVETEIAYQVIKTENGKRQTVTLTNGTTVHLNSGSSLRFPNEFSTEERKVYLEGEAFFDVSKRKNWPFIIATDFSNVKVLGTRFNVNSFENNEHTTVAVEEGKVSMTSNENKANSMILTTGMVAEMDNASSQIGLKEIDINDVLGWRTKTLVLNNKSLAKSFKMLERWYGVEIITDKNTDYNKCIINGVFEDMPLEQVLESLEFIYGLKFEITENKVSIKDAHCIY